MNDRPDFLYLYDTPARTDGMRFAVQDTADLGQAGVTALFRELAPALRYLEMERLGGRKVVIMPSVERLL